MKQIIKTIAFAALLFVAAACNDAKYSVIENRLFISEAAPGSGTPQQVESLTVSGDVSTTIHARMVRPLDYDVTVYIGLAKEFVDEYNDRFGTEYEVLPDNLFTFDRKAVITAGSVVSSDIAIDVKAFTSDVTYCIPLMITATDSNVEITETTSRIMYVLATPLIQYVPIFDYSQQPTSTGDWGAAMNEWTLEAWFYTDGLNENQTFFNFNCSKGNLIHVRLEDPIGVWDQMQMTTYGTYFNSIAHFSINTWYHIAYTCGNGTVTLYINGEYDSSKDISGTEYQVENVTLCSSGSQYFRHKARLAQIRFWNTCLSQSIIQKRMNSSVPENTAGLVGYWKMDEGEGSVFHDSSPNGHDLTCSTAPGWSSEPVDFTNPNK
ncbi:MAG: DUF1735 domain-containing protein [Bacteroidales bacterium]|nr:DUF1735 domain-containing protein [Bacteroidales bacterium]